MVQRKVNNKLGIQAEHHVKSEKLLANLKPSASQYQDGKNRGPDMKKKMKKSRSIKLSDIESIRSSSPLRRNRAQPGKPPPPPPPVCLPATAAITQKQALVKAEAWPNYMKSTSSSEARKERSQVNPPRRHSTGSTLCISSGNKPSKTLTRTSSLKLVRTLTKSPSFKQVRASLKKCTKVALCADIKAQRATCSSTLKDSKFPSYLTLSPGGTESQGASVMKVCPYTYCSLNGHLHASLPPLKLFLSARRRSLKVQKSMKLAALSPRKAKWPCDGMKEISTGLLISDDKPAYEEVDLGESAASPSIHEVDTDFFIEIYTKNKEDDVQAIKESTDADDEGTINFFGELEDHKDIVSSFEIADEAVERDDGKQVAESLPDGSPHSCIDFDENLEKEMDVTDEYYQSTPVQEEKTLESSGRWIDFEGESSASTEVDDNVSEATDMEWKEGQFSASQFAHEVKTEEESDWNAGYILDDIVSNSEQIILQENFEDESACLGAEFSEGNSERDAINQNLEVQEFSQPSDSSSYDQLPSTEDVSEELITMEEKSEIDEMDLINTVISSASWEESIVEITAASEEMQEKGVPEAENETPKTEPQTEYDNINTLLGNQNPDAYWNLIEIDHNETNEEDGGSRKTEDSETGQNVRPVPSVDAGIQISSSFQGLFEADQDNSELELLREMDEPCHGITEDTNLSKHIAHENQNFLEKDEGEAQKLNISSSMDSKEQSDSRMGKLSSLEHCTGAVDMIELEESRESDTGELLTTKNMIIPELGSISFRARRHSNQELPDIYNKQKWTIRSKNIIKDCEDPRKFNPREPNYLPAVPDPEAEKVDLRHQMMDERRNTEEWMLDYALRRAVTQLAPARKKKVALLVEAFETVMPIPKYETHMRHTSAAFAPARPIQACS